MNLDDLLASNYDGAVVRLPAGTYPINGSITKPVTIEASTLVAPGSRPTGSDVILLAGPGGLIVDAADVTLRGVDVQCVQPQRNIIQALGPRFRLDRSLVTGSGTDGARRGIAVNGDTWTLVDSVIRRCWQADSEAQAVAGWDGCRNGLIDNCRLEGGSQALLLGGGDSVSASRVPTHVRVLRSDLWVGEPRGWVKTAFELKACIGFYSADCTFTGAGTAQQQQGYVMVLKAANQDGGAPWSATQGVLIERFTASHAAGCVDIVGQDGNHPARVMSNITLRQGRFTDIDGTRFIGASGRGFTWQSGAVDVTLEDVDVQAVNMAASMYLIAPQPVRMVLRRVHLPEAYYGVKIDAGPLLQTPAQITAGLKAWAPDAIVDGITVG